MNLTRRAALAGGLATGTALFVPFEASRAADYNKPFKGFAPPSTVLKEGSPASVGLDPAPIETAKRVVRGYETAPAGGHPLYPGHVGLMAHDGVVVATQVSGYAVRYRTATEELPEADRVPMRRDTIFDLASVSKLFTSIVVVQLIEEGRVELEAPVATYLPEFAAAGKEGVTIRHLLTHTSGFTSWLPLYSKYPDKASRIAAVMNQPLTNPAGTVYLYSDLNLITLDDLAILAQTLLNGGVYRKARVLDRKSVSLLITNFNDAFPGDDHGLGFELNQIWYMDALSGPRTAGHTGYTGTSLVIDFDSRSIAILLTNRVHPSRSWGSINEPRRQWAGGLGRALPISARGRHVRWETDPQHASNAILSLPLTVGERGARLGFDLIAETEETDVLSVETTLDGATWALLPLDLRPPGDTREAEDGTVSGTPGERRWRQVRASLPAGARGVRWRYTTDANTSGRGVSVTRVRVVGARGGVIDSDRDTGAFAASGWSLHRRS